MIVSEEQTASVDVAAPREPSPEPAKPDVVELPKPQPKRSGGLGEWLWRTRAVREARAVLTKKSALELERLKRARIAAELADRALDPIDALRAGSSVPLALSLYREAAYWALLAQSKDLQAADLREAFARSKSALLAFAAGGEEGLDLVRAALLEKSFVQTAEDVAEIQQRDAVVARDFVRALLLAKSGDDKELNGLLLQRWARTMLLALVVFGAAAGVAIAMSRLPAAPDLALGKPWRTSSTYPDCQLHEHRCGNTATKIFFHTLEEKNPWVEIDLGARTRFSKVEIINRSDCCPDRAIPMVLEVSNDQSKWKEIARRSDAFSSWKATFAIQNARYVRARVLKRSTLHLERFSVHAD